ncbi:MAG: glycosyltransferase family 4 protein [Cellulomonas sp.]|nr:glycosyltransferase family 4 protein [Cellulomonas sp.]
MRVLLDATAVPMNRGGVGRYVDDIVPALVELGVDIVLACQARDVEVFGQRVPAATVVAAPGAVARRPVRLMWEQTGLPALARRMKVDVVHSPHYTMPLRSPVPVAVTLHDATFFSDPGVHQAAKVALFRTATRAAVRRAGALIVPSRATRDEILRLAGGRPGQFVVAPHGVDLERFRPAGAAEIDRVRGALALGDRPYVAFLGTLEPRKNLSALVRGWVAACRNLPDPPALVLAGGSGWDAQLDAAIAEVPAALTLVRPGYLPLEDLAGLLTGAAVVAYPSLGEGFGLPVLEAMACGAPVLTTRRLSLPEVGGDAVAYCDVSPESIAKELARVLRDEELRASLSVAALARARTFSWAASAAQHVKAYELAARR